MAKTYRTPVVASLGTAEVMTGAPRNIGTHQEVSGFKTTAQLLDL